MESVLMDAEKHFENLEKDRIAKLQLERVGLISEYIEDAHERDLSSMDEDVWESYLSTKKQAYLDRLNAEKEEEEKRAAEDKAEKERLEAIEKDNAKLKAEAELKEKQAEKERLEREKIEADRLEKLKLENLERVKKEQAEKEKQDAILKKANDEKEALAKELKEKEIAAQKQKEIEAKKIQDDLNKGDSAKVKDLINDLELLKTKYSFKSDKNVKKYSDVGLLIDEVINHIQ